MAWLPPISIGRKRPRLPLVPQTAARLEAILLTHSRRRRYRRLRSLLAGDPALLIWALGNLSPGRRAQCERIETVAQLASRHLLVWLAPYALEKPPGKKDQHPDASPLTASAEIAGAATAVAELARDLARTGDGGLSREAYFLGLLHSVRNWLSFATGKSPTEQELVRWLPDCCTFDDEATTPATAALRAIALLSGETAPNETETGPLEAAKRRRSEVQRGWSEESRAASYQLKSLLKRLTRLDDLQQRFQQTLLYEKLESLRQLAYGASHEINNPLANISARAQTLLRDETDPERRRKLAAIKTQAHRAHEMIADLMLFSRPPELKIASVDLSRLIRDLATELDGQAREQDTELRLSGVDRTRTLDADPVQLQVALRALITNSLEAIGQGGMICIDVRRQTKQGEPFVRIEVSDDGPGIHADASRHLFDPFYSGREAGRGLGFGLSKCWRIVTGHGGQIDVDSPTTGGAIFRIAMPIRQRPDPDSPNLNPNPLLATE